MSSYKDAGVDINAADAFVERIKEMPGTSSIGGFAGEFPLGDYHDWDEASLVSTSDGIGTKFDLAWGHDSLGFQFNAGLDLVAAIVNDLLAAGARPLFMLDYLSLPDMNPAKKFVKAEATVRGIAEGCRFTGMKLLGGETAEMPGHQKASLAGFGVGVKDVLGGPWPEAIEVGDTLVGFPSNGLHANGFSLVTRVLGNETHKDPLLFSTIMKPAKIYLTELEGVFGLLGQAHITGGGLEANIQRTLPDGLTPDIDWDRWKPQPIFNHIQAKGVEIDEMRKVFNMGIGFVVVVREKVAKGLLQERKGIIIGSVK